MKNTGKGLPWFASIIIGVNIVAIDAPNQFIIVAQGTFFAGRIYGTYNLIGAIVRPNTATKRIRSTVHMIPVGDQSLKMKNIANAILRIVRMRFPIRMICFLPNLAKMGIVIMLQKN